MRWRWPTVLLLAGGGEMIFGFWDITGGGDSGLDLIIMSAYGLQMIQ